MSVGEVIGRDSEADVCPLGTIPVSLSFVTLTQMLLLRDAMPTIFYSLTSLLFVSNDEDDDIADESLLNHAASFLYHRLLIIVY